MRIAFIAAGAAGMYCGSCLRDNALASAMIRLGHEVSVIPLYTPLRVDGEDATNAPIFYGGIGVYLRQKSALFRRLPRFVSVILDSRPLLNLSSKLAGMNQASDLGELTLSILQGEEGTQKEELFRLARWLNDEIKPQIINLPNSMFAGTARVLREIVGAPVVCSLTGEDLFLDSLNEPWKSDAMNLLRRRAKDVDGFIAISRYYADFMSSYLEVPREKISVVPLGIEAEKFGRRNSRPTDPFTVGYLARIAPEKGLSILCEAFRQFKKIPGTETARLRAAGYLGACDLPYLEKIQSDLRDWGLAESFDHIGEVSLQEKLQFLDSISVLSVPTVYHDPKGLFVLEALAHGVPVVQPAHGAFPELIEATKGGLLFESGNVADLAAKLHRLMTDREVADRLALHGQQAVRQKFTDIQMARETVRVYESHLA